jgi:septal ring factor EnvC (AmiA/AmiB activator)
MDTMVKKMKTIIIIILSALSMSAQDTTFVTYSKPLKGVITVRETKQFKDRTIIEERKINAAEIQKELEKELQLIEMLRQEDVFMQEQIDNLKKRIEDNRRSMRAAQRKIQAIQKLGK